MIKAAIKVLWVVLVLMNASAQGQVLEREVLASAGMSFQANGMVIASTIGQTIVGREFLSSGSVNQGFQQPRVQAEEITGCLDDDACNYNPLATLPDDSCDFLSCVIGCTDPNACNFDPDVIADDGSCDFSCCPGPGCCNDGTHWDEVSQTCIVTFPADITFDGCSGAEDLLALLAAFGLCLN